MSKVKIGIIGCGGIANNKHMPSIKANSELGEMVAFCDIIVALKRPVKSTALPAQRYMPTTKSCWLTPRSKLSMSVPPTLPTAPSPATLLQLVSMSCAKSPWLLL